MNAKISKIREDLELESGKPWSLPPEKVFENRELFLRIFIDQYKLKNSTFLSRCRFDGILNLQKNMLGLLPFNRDTGEC